MKRICMMLAAVCLLCGCTDGRTAHSETAESSFDPFYMPPLNMSDRIDANFGFGLTDPPENDRFAYSDEMTLRFYADNAAQEADFGLMLFVNGVLQEYRFEEEPAKSTLFRFPVGKDEKREFTVSFSPKAAESDSECVLSYSLMFHPDFTPQSAQCSFGNYYRLMSLSASLTDVPDGCKTVKTLRAAETAPIPEELRAKYYELDADGNVVSDLLRTSTQLRTEKLSADYPDAADDPAPNALHRGDSVRLTLLGGAKERTWRISMYCDHALVTAFDSAQYLDMTASNETMSVYTVPVSVIGKREPEFGSVYFVAAPLGADAADDPYRSHVFVYAGE